MDNANEKHYISKIEEDIDKVIDLIGSSDGILSIWQKDKEVEPYKIQDYKQDLHKLILKCGPDIWSMFKESIYENQEVLVKIIFGKFIYFTSTTLKRVEEEDLYFIVLDQDIFQALQRSSFRLKATARRKIKLRISLSEVDKITIDNCLDVSLGGASFYIDSSDQEKYTVGKIFSNCTLIFNGIPFNIPKLEVARAFLKDNDPEKTFVGVKFNELTTGVEHTLFKEINSEIRLEMIMEYKK